jgi:hypothetical protein
MTTHTPHSIEFTAPVLAYAPAEYSMSYFNYHNNTLRLYFNRIDETLRAGDSQEYSESLSWFLS